MQKNNNDETGINLCEPARGVIETNVSILFEISESDLQKIEGERHNWPDVSLDERAIYHTPNGYFGIRACDQNGTVVTVYFTDTVGELVTSVSAMISSTSNTTVTEIAGCRHQVISAGNISMEQLLGTLYPGFIETERQSKQGLLLIDEYTIKQNEARRTACGNRAILITQAEQEEYLNQLRYGLDWYVANMQNLPRPLMSLERHLVMMDHIEQIINRGLSEDEANLLSNFVKAFFTTTDKVASKFLTNWIAKILDSDVAGFNNREVVEYTELVGKYFSIQDLYIADSGKINSLIQDLWDSHNELQDNVWTPWNTNLFRRVEL